MARLGRAAPGFIIIRGPIATTQSWTVWQGTAAFSPVAALVAGAIDVVPGVVTTLAPVAGLTAAGSNLAEGVVTLAPVAGLTSAAVDQPLGVAALTPTASLTVAAGYIAQGAVALSATAAFSATATETEFASVAFSDSVSLTVGTQSVYQAAATLSPTAGLTIAVKQTAFTQATLTPSAGLTVSGIVVQPAGVSLTLSAALNVVTPAGLYQASALLAPSMHLSIAAGSNYTGTVFLTPATALTITEPSQVQMAQVLLAPFSLLRIGAFQFGSTVTFQPTIALTAIANVGLNIGTIQPYFLRQKQDWAVQQERQRHAEALYFVGEMVCIILMWHEIDFQEGLVQRCQTCYNTPNPLNNRITAVYNQPTRNLCPDCFGTTFEGGYRARIVRPAILTDTDETERQDRKGSMHPFSMNMETTWDFRSRAGDYMLRSDGSRWRLSDPQRITLRAGFAHPAQATSAITYTNIRAQYEESTTVAYIIPPTDPNQLNAVLTAVSFFPPDFSSFEDIRADLIPQALQD